MRVMVIVRADARSEAGQLAEPKLFADMDVYNDSLIEAGVMIMGEGLTASSQGALLRFSGGASTVERGPILDASVAGFWLWRVQSLDQAIEWARKAPFTDAILELRPMFEKEDFPKLDLDPDGLDTREQIERFTGIPTS